jgi:hypothetical protein
MLGEHLVQRLELRIASPQIPAYEPGMFLVKSETAR